jgi:hypothetical protein
MEASGRVHTSVGLIPEKEHTVVTTQESGLRNRCTRGGEGKNVLTLRPQSSDLELVTVPTEIFRLPVINNILRIKEFFSYFPSSQKKIVEKLRSEGSESVIPVHLSMLSDFVFKDCCKL